MRSVILFVALLLCLTYVSADTCSTGQTAYSLSSSTSAGSASKLVLANNLGFNVDVQYVISSGSDVGYSVTGCVDNSIASTMGFQFTKTSDTITLTAALNTVTTTTTTKAPGQVSPTNSASKSGMTPITTFLALAFGLVFVVRPKSASSVALLMAILGVAVYAHADSQGTNTIVVKITVPDSITQFCSDANTCKTKSAGDVDNYVNVMSDRYATMDMGKSCDVDKVMYLPENWRIAAVSDSTVGLALAFNSWSTNSFVLADGNMYANGQDKVQVGTNGFKTVDNGGSTGYQVTSCPSKILIVQRFPLTNSNPSIVSALSVTPAVTFNGYDYATADNIDYSKKSSGAQVGGISISTSDAWQVATDDDDSVAVALASNKNFFGADCVVLASGKSYNNTFGLCGTNALVKVSITGAVVYGVNATAGNARIVIRRATTSTNSTFLASISPIYSYVNADNNALEYATLDSADPANNYDTNCQSRFYAVPSGYAIATSSQLGTFGLIAQAAGYTMWTTTKVLVGVDLAFANNAGADTNVNLVKKTVASVDYYFTSSCARILITRTYSTKTDFTIGLKLLFITQTQSSTSSDSGEVALVKQVMQATGISYDWLPLTDAGSNKLYPNSLPLKDDAGNPKYYGIIMSQSGLTYYNTNDKILTATQQAQLNQYQYQYSVRMVALNGNPNDYGMSGANNGNGAGTTMNWVAAFTTAHTSLFGGVVTTPAPAYNVSTQSYYPVATQAGDKYNVESMLNLKVSTTDAVAKIVAGIVTPKLTVGKYEIMQFWIGNAVFLDHGPIVANVWLTWVTRGIWMGNRRIYLSPQIDDYFLATGQYGQPDDMAHSVRINITDVDRTYDYLEGLKAILPNNSHVTLAMAVNCGEADLAETGSSLVTAAKKYINYFWWESHTWTHLDFTRSPEEACDWEASDPATRKPLDPTVPACHNTTYSEALLELTKNNDYVTKNLFTAQGLDTPTWSKNSMITPAITGLFNPAALKALYDAGMTCVVGDNTRPELVPANPYLGMFTSVANNGYDGIFIIPRYATEIYFNSATPEINMKQYNERYGPTRLPIYNATAPAFTVNSTLDDLLGREANTVFRQLAFFRHDPYMFHQCNLYHFGYKYAKDTEYKQWSLTSLWLQTVIDKYNTYLNFPLLGVTQQALRDVYFARREREYCGISGSIEVSGGNTKSVTLSTTGKCEASLTAPATCAGLSASECRTDPYGADTTLWAQMTPNVAKKISVSTAWN